MWAASVPCEAGGDEHPGPRGGPEVAHVVAPICWLGMDIHVPHRPIHLRDISME